MTLYYRLGSNLYVNITNLCQCDCVFCVRGRSRGVGDAESLWLAHEPTPDELKQAFDLRQDLDDVNEIVFCGYGEPLERAEVVVDLARHIRLGTDKTLRLNTNGLVSLINPGFDKTKLDIFDTISVSLNAATKEGYMEVTRPVFGEQSFDSMLGFAKDMSRVARVQFTIVETLPDEQKEKCRTMAESMGIPLIVRNLI